MRQHCLLVCLSSSGASLVTSGTGSRHTADTADLLQSVIFIFCKVLPVPITLLLLRLSHIVRLSQNSNKSDVGQINRNDDSFLF